MNSSNTKSNSSFNKRFRHFLICIGKTLIQTVKIIKQIFDLIKSNSLNLATIATAIAAIITIYFTVLQPAKVEIQSGSYVAITPACECSETDKSGYILKIPVSFYNDGAKPGIIARVGLVIKDPDNMYAYFFKSNYDEILKQEKEKKIWQLNSAFSPIIVPPRNAISRILAFETSGLIFLPNKIYSFWILAWDKEATNPTYRKEFKFSFESKEIESVEVTRQKQIENTKQKQKNLKNSSTAQDGNTINTITSPENGKYGPITGAIDGRMYQSLTGRN
jgi:hypothetical protein